jgi:hypothetical protein
VTGLFYALLVVVAGSLVVAFGVGGIPIARRYLEQWSGRAEQTATEIKATGAAQTAKARAERIREDVVTGGSEATAPTEPIPPRPR